MAHLQTDSRAAYSGPERRRRRVYVTRNHEYHCLDGICIAVRDVRSGAFVTKHAAIGKQVSAALRLNENGIESISPPDAPHPGERIHFVDAVDDQRDVLTSPLRAMERPPASIIAEYPPQAP